MTFEVTYMENEKRCVDVIRADLYINGDTGHVFRNRMTTEMEEREEYNCAGGQLVAEYRKEHVIKILCLDL
jgi:hypothetical protein